jgi:mRNA-degrading endonuclease toxin of MazEF toxin-antitoxin module
VDIPPPEPGLVIRYAYLWRREFDSRREEGRKDRPCAVVLAAPAKSDGLRVYVLPVTHTAPNDPDLAIEIPRRVKQHLRLDDERSWIVLDEINDFLWPGFDLRPVPGSQPTRVNYGVLPPRFFDRVRGAFLALARERKVKRVPRA